MNTFTSVFGNRCRCASLCVLVAVTALPLILRATTASPEGLVVLQPNGFPFELRLKGDEYFYWHETADGYAVVLNAVDGYWEYAEPAPDRAGFIPLPGERVGFVDPAELGLVPHAMPALEWLQQAWIEGASSSCGANRSACRLPNPFPARIPRLPRWTPRPRCRASDPTATS